MGLLDVFTGGKSGEAADAMKRAEEYFKNVTAPTQEQLTLPELQKYVEMGVMTPAQAQSYLQQNNAYENMNVPQTGTAAQVAALNKLSEVANAGPNGTPLEQAQMENSLSKMNNAVGAQRGAIEQQMAARGTPYALIQAALANQTVGQEGQQAHLDAVNAQSAAYQNALNALSQQGQVGNSLQGQQNTQANTVANAANAMQQFNAQNQQQNSQFNAANQQQANAYNTQNKQNVGNQNVGLSNARTQYNAALPQQVFANNMAKAQGMAGAAQNIGNLYQNQGQQTSGIIGGLINAGTSMIPAGGAAKAAGGGFQAQNPTEAGMNQAYQRGYAHGGTIPSPYDPGEPISIGSTRGYHDHSICMAHGGYCMAEGGQVPGEANYSGDTQMNDTVMANLSPGEAVIPRETVAHNPEVVGSLLGQQDQGSQIDFQDIASVLKALRSLRMGVA